MDEKSIKRRNWIKNIAIIFLAVMLILTLFSSTIMNFSLPEVSAQYCYSGTISTRIRGNGNVEASESYNVKAGITGKIKEIGAKVGMAIEAGAVLYTLEASKGENLITAKEELAALLRTYNELISKTSGNLTELLKNIDLRQAEYDALNKLKNEAADAKIELQTVKDEYKAQEKAVNKLKNDVLKLEQKISSLSAVEGIDEASGIISEAKAKKDAAYNALEAGKAAKRKAQDEVKEYTALVAKAEKALTEFKATLPEQVNIKDIETLEQTIEDLQRTYERALLDYNEKIEDHNIQLAELNSKWEQAYQELQIAQSKLTSAVSEEDREAAQLVYDSARTAFDNAQAALDNHKNSLNDSLKSDQRALEDQRITIERRQAALDDMYTANYEYSKYTSQLKTLESNVDIAKLKLSDANLALEIAVLALDGADGDSITLQTEYNDAKKYLELLENADSLTAFNLELTSMEKQLEKATDELDTINENKTELESKISANPTESALNEARQKVQDAKSEYATEKSKYTNEETVTELEISIAKQKVEDQEAKIKKIEEGVTTEEIKAPIAGTITSMAFKAGDEVVLESVVAGIQRPESGYTLKYGVTLEQSRRIKVGETAKIEYYWWGDTPTATVESITVDQSNPSQSRIVSLKITGEIQIGTQLTFTLGEKSQNYDTVVPNSAVKEDASGSFVLVVDVKNTPLGNRYKARRVDVSVLSKDDMNSAVMGLSMGDYVITTSAKPITSGMQVRLSES